MPLTIEDNDTLELTTPNNRPRLNKVETSRADDPCGED